MERRTFLLSAGTAVAWIGTSVMVSGCSDSSAPEVPTAGPGDVTGLVSANHGHAAVVTGAQVTSGNAVTLTLTSGNGHTHSLSLTSSQVTSVGAGTRVSAITAPSGGHSHTVTFN